MKGMAEKLKELFFEHIGICVAFLCVIPLVFVGHGLFYDVEVEDVGGSEQEDLIVVGFSQLGSESMWRTAHTNSIQEALTKDAGYFLIFNNARQKQENQIKAIRSFISQRVDYIVFSPVTEDGWDTVLEEAKEAGIPVIIVDRMVNVEDDSLYTCWIGTDAMEEGEKAGEWLEKYLKEKRREDMQINIVELQGTLGSTAQLGRTEGFKKVAKEHPNWHVVERAGGEFTTMRGKEVMQEILRRHDNIDVLIAQNDDMAFGAIEAMEEAGVSYGAYGKVIIISFDAVHDALEMVDKGQINVDIECNPLQGEYIREVIQKLENGEAVEKNYSVEERIFTKDNVAEYLDDRVY